MEKVKQFYEALTNSEAMKERALKLSEKLGDGIDEEAASAEIIAFAASEGYDFTAEELAEYAETAKIREVPDSEMDAVSGGSSTARCGIDCWDLCMCVFGGGGKCHNPSHTCACVLGGGGKSCAHGTFLMCPLAGGVSY